MHQLRPAINRLTAGAHLITGRVGGLHTAGVLMLSAVDGRPSGRWRAWTTGRPCIQSVCNRTPPAMRDASLIAGGVLCSYAE